MKLIKEVEPTRLNNQRVRQGLFECPICNNHVVKRMSHGKVNKTCGSKECKSKALSAGSINREYDGDARRTHGLSSKPYYSLLKKIWNTSVKNDSEWKSLHDFVTDMYNCFSNIRMYAVNGRTKLLKKNKDLPHSKENSYFDASDKTKEAIRLKALSWTGSNTAKLGAELSANFELINRALMSSIEKYKDVFDENDFKGLSPRTKTVYKLTENQRDKVIEELLSLKSMTASDKVYIVTTPYIKDNEISIAHKIGITHDIEKRISSLKNSNPNGIELLYVSEEIDFVTTVEKFLHDKYSDKNIFREWFELNNDDIGEITRILDDSKPVLVAINYFEDKRAKEEKAKQREAVKAQLAKQAYENLKKLDKAYKTKQEAKEITKAHIEPVTPKSSHKKATGWSCREYTMPSKQKEVYQFTLDGELIAKFNSITEASKETGIGHIGAVCNGKRKHAGGYLWSFDEHVEPVKQVRMAGKDILIYKNGKHIDTLNKQKDICDKYGIANATLTRRLRDGKDWNEYRFEYKEMA